MVTVIVHVATRFSGENAAFAVITTVPAEIAVTLPFASTVATDSSEDNQITLLSVASSGVTFAVSVKLSPVFKLAVVLSMVIASARTLSATL